MSMDIRQAQDKKYSDEIFYDTRLGVPYCDTINDPLIKDCVTYAKTQGWELHPARHTFDGPMGHIDFVRMYEGKQWDGHGYSVQSLTCIISQAVKLHYSRQKSCPKCCFEFCYKYKNILSPQNKARLKSYCQKKLFT